MYCRCFPLHWLASLCCISPIRLLLGFGFWLLPFLAPGSPWLCSLFRLRHHWCCTALHQDTPLSKTFHSHKKTHAYGKCGAGSISSLSRPRRAGWRSNWQSACSAQISTLGNCADSVCGESRCAPTTLYHQRLTRALKIHVRCVAAPARLQAPACACAAVAAVPM